MVLAVSFSPHLLSRNHPAQQNDPGSINDLPRLLEQHLLRQTYRSTSKRKAARGADALEKVEQINFDRESEFDDDHIGVGYDDANPPITIRVSGLRTTP